MNEVETYLKRIVHHSGLRRSEQNEWVAEMATHLLDRVEHLKLTGMGEHDALKKALHQFGNRREIRRQIAKQTFGVTLPVITSLASLFFLLFLVGTYLLYASIQSNPSPLTWVSWHENSWVRLFTTHVPISPSLMLALCLDTLMLIKTRCQKDRWVIVIITGIFSALWLLMRMSHRYYLATLLVPDWGPHPAPFGFGNILLFCLSIGTYLLTRNKSISRLPIFLSLTIGLWVPVRDSIQYHLWQATHWSGFWGHHEPNWYGVLLIIAIQMVILAVLNYIFRAIQHLDERKRLTA